MPLTGEDIERIRAHARAVGQTTGWDLDFVVAPNPEYVGLVAGVVGHQIFVWGPSKLSNLAAYELDFILDELERGERTIELDDEGDPRLF